MSVKESREDRICKVKKVCSAVRFMVLLLYMACRNSSEGRLINRSYSSASLAIVYNSDQLLQFYDRAIEDH